MNEQTIKLEERLIRFSLLIVEITASLPKSKLGNYIKDQLTRSGLSFLHLIMARLNLLNLN